MLFVATCVLVADFGEASAVLRLRIDAPVEVRLPSVLVAANDNRFCPSLAGAAGGAIELRPLVVASELWAVTLGRGRLSLAAED